jgi:hypothetical protein
VRGAVAVDALGALRRELRQPVLDVRHPREQPLPRAAAGAGAVVAPRLQLGGVRGSASSTSAASSSFASTSSSASSTSAASCSASTSSPSASSTSATSSAASSSTLFASSASPSTAPEELLPAANALGQRAVADLG